MLDAVISAMPKAHARAFAVLSLPPRSTSAHSQGPRLWLRLSAWLEAALVQLMLALVLWPLKVIYRRPQETWPAWFANQKLCALDRRFC